MRVPRPAVQRHQPAMRTTCGRTIRVGRIAVGDLSSLAHRVTLDVGECGGGCHDSAWASLTAAEARLLATALLAEAELVEVAVAELRA